MSFGCGGLEVELEGTENEGGEDDGIELVEDDGEKLEDGEIEGFDANEDPSQQTIGIVFDLNAQIVGVIPLEAFSSIPGQSSGSLQIPGWFVYLSLQELPTS